MRIIKLQARLIGMHFQRQAVAREVTRAPSAIPRPPDRITKFPSKRTRSPPFI